MTDSLLSSQDRQEALSRAYAHAIAAAAGYTTYAPDLDRDSVDLGFSAGGAMRPNLHAQLKATISLSKAGNVFKFVVKKKNYDDLRAVTQVPRLLIVLGMPRKEQNWLNVSPARLLLRRCAHWVSLRGLPDLPADQATKTVEIPTTNVFDVDALKMLMEKARTGTPL
ncbi:DUF4365 domain-containing protein [Bradyrhizobium manausense]